QGGGGIYAPRPVLDLAPAPVLTTQFGEVGHTLSPDGHWMAYVSDESGRREIYVVPFPNVSSAKGPLSTQGGTEPLWSHSGKEVFYRDGFNNLVSVAVSTSPTFAAGATTTLFPARDFINNGNNRGYDITADD